MQNIVSKKGEIKVKNMLNSVKNTLLDCAKMTVFAHELEELYFNYLEYDDNRKSVIKSIPHFSEKEQQLQQLLKEMSDEIKLQIDKKLEYVQEYRDVIPQKHQVMEIPRSLIQKITNHKILLNFDKGEQEGWKVWLSKKYLSEDIKGKDSITFNYYDNMQYKFVLNHKEGTKWIEDEVKKVEGSLLAKYVDNYKKYIEKEILAHDQLKDNGKSNNELLEEISSVIWDLYGYLYDDNQFDEIYDAINKDIQEGNLEGLKQDLIRQQLELELEGKGEELKDLIVKIDRYSQQEDNNITTKSNILYYEER